MKRHEMEIWGGRKVVVHEHEDVYDPQTGTAYTGSWLWKSSLVLTHSITSINFKGKRVVELGAGTGLPGIVAVMLGAHEVVLTDISPLLPGLQRNVDENGLGERVKVMELVWGEDGAEISSTNVMPLDYVLMSDLLYDVRAMPALCHTLRKIIGEGNATRILMCCELRFGTYDCLDAMEEHGFVISKVPHCQLHPAWQDEDYAIYVATLETPKNMDGLE